MNNFLSHVDCAIFCIDNTAIYLQQTMFVLLILTCSVGLFSSTNDYFLETSATAIYTYSIARAINRGWIDKKAYGPMVLLAWKAVASKINANGQVEGNCVGMGFDPAFYYYRPVNIYAAWVLTCITGRGRNDSSFKK